MDYIIPSQPFPPAHGGQHIRIGVQGQNWIHVGSQIATQLGNYLTKIDRKATVSMVVGQIMDMCMEGPIWASQGHYEMGITTPAWYINNAVEGRGRFEKPLPISVIGVLPHEDYLTLAVRPETGIRSLHDIRERKFPLRVSMHTMEDYTPAAVVLNQLFKLYGFSVEDIVSWGGEILGFDYSAYTATVGEPVDPGFHAVFDEAIMTRRWHRISEKYDLNYLPIEEDMLQKCEALGMRRSFIPKGHLRGVTEDVPTIDFGGWALYCRSDIPDDIAYLSARALHAQQAEINKRFAVDFPGMTGPIEILNCDQTDLPVHPGAQRYYAEVRAAAKEA